MLGRHSTIVAARHASHTLVGGVTSAAAVAAASSLPSSSLSFAAASSSGRSSSFLSSCVRRSLHTSSSLLAHNPRTLRGVGPAPRVAAFYKRPWLKRRLAAVRKQFWPVTHHTPKLDAPVDTAKPAELQLPTRNLQTGEDTGTVSLNPSVFSVPLRRDIIWTVVRWQRACRRSGHHKNKDRSEVWGSGKKARPQKGTGRARMGDPHAPHHVGGGHTWARRQTDYSYKLPQQIINLGKRVALSAKAAEGNLFVIDEPVLSEASRETFERTMVANGWATYLMVHLHGELDPNLAIASQKYTKYDYLSDRQLNVYDIVKAKRLVITRKALLAIEWRLNKANTNNLTRERTMRWMVGSFGGGYTRAQIDFVKPNAKIEGDAKIVPGVDVDGLKLVIKAGKPYETPVHWP